jgi:hypothetical protein
MGKNVAFPIISKNFQTLYLEYLSGKFLFDTNPYSTHSFYKIGSAFFLIQNDQRLYRTELIFKFLSLPWNFKYVFMGVRDPANIKLLLST